jgi:glycosyltransferase involved in cell wall biosynthesis
MPPQSTFTGRSRRRKTHPWVKAGDSLARAIATLAGDRRQLLDMRHGSRRLAESEFDREKTYARFADWLEGISRASRG